MTKDSVFFHRLLPSSLNPDYQEVYRYMGYMLKDRNPQDDDIKPLVVKVCEEMKLLMQPQCTYACYDLSIKDDLLIFGGNQVQSKELSRYMKDCHSIYLFAATLGPKVDREIQKHTKIDPVKAVVMQAAGAMYIEEYCDIFCDEIANEVKKENFAVKHRYSPGFGDVSLEVQKLFFSVLGCKKIGLTLMDSLIMAPEKSVSAFIGVKNDE